MNSSNTLEEGGSGDKAWDIQADSPLHDNGPAGDGGGSKFFGYWSFEMEEIDKLRGEYQLICDAIAPRMPIDSERRHLSSPKFSFPAIGEIPASAWSCHLGIFKDENGVDYMSMVVILRGFPDLPAGSSASLNAAFQIDLMRPRSDGVLLSRNKRVETFGPAVADMCSGWRKFAKFGFDRADSFKAALPFKLTLTVSGSKVILPKPIEIETLQNAAKSNSEPKETADCQEESPTDATEEAAITCLEENDDVAVLCKYSRFKAHRSVLFDCSKVLAAQIEECNVLGTHAQYILNLTDIPDNWVENLLEYCYTNDTPALKHFPGCVKMCRIGDRFQMKSLVKDAFFQLMEFAGNPVKTWAIVFYLKEIVEFILDDLDCMLLLQKKIQENFDRLQKDKHFEHWYLDGGYPFIDALLVTDLSY